MEIFWGKGRGKNRRSIRGDTVQEREMGMYVQYERRAAVVIEA